MLVIAACAFQIFKFSIPCHHPRSHGGDNEMTQRGDSIWLHPQQQIARLIPAKSKRHVCLLKPRNWFSFWYNQHNSNTREKSSTGTFNNILSKIVPVEPKSGRWLLWIWCSRSQTQKNMCSTYNK